MSPGSEVRSKVSRYHWARVLEGGLERWVYFAQREEGGLVKVGHTYDLKKRMRSLELAIASPVRVLAAVPTWVLRESEAHQMLATQRATGEWFEPQEAVFALADNALAYWERSRNRRDRFLRLCRDGFFHPPRPLAQLALVEREFRRRARWRIKYGIDY